jgi:hypothetical protein
MGKKNNHALVNKAENLKNRKFKARATSKIGGAKRLTKDEVLDHLHAQSFI